LSHLSIKFIFLPRQARDNHRENSKNERRFLSGDEDFADGAGLDFDEEVRKRISFAMPCDTANDHFTKTGSGQT
jgi:hypothetical protein